MQFLKSLEKTYSIWYATLVFRMFNNKIEDIIDESVDNDHDDEIGQLAWARPGSHYLAKAHAVRK